MQKKLLSFFLCLVTILTTVSTAFAVTPASAATPTVRVYFEDEEISSISVPQNEKKTLSAKCDYVDDAQFQWQVLADIKSDLWVDIQGQNKSDIEASKALVRGVMDSSNSAYIRATTIFAGERLFSEPVSVTIKDIEAPAAEKKLSKSKLRAAVRSVDDEIDPYADGDNVYVIVNYLDAEKGTEVWAPSRIQFKKGEPATISQTFLSPAWIGFKPYYCAENPSTDNPELAKDDASRIEINLEDKMLEEDIVYNVFYKPAMVPYAAKFFYQNIYDDMYTEDAAKYYQDQEFTGTIVGEKLTEHGEQPGFTPLFHFPEAVAADGSTVFEFYYDRNYYLISFDLDGGFGTEPIYAKYDTPFFVNQPERAGYAFMGWDLCDEDNPNGDGNPDKIPETVPAGDCKYKAIWQKTQVTYTIIYWAENAEDDNYSFWGYRTVGAYSGDTMSVNQDPTNAEMIDNNEIKYFTYNPEMSDKTVTVKGDGSSIANVYFTRNEYTLVFYDTRTGSSDYLCGYTSENSHVHTDECYELICDLEEHTHDGSCLTCGMQEHTHTNACCSFAEHSHNASCPTDNCTHTQHDLSCYTTQRLTVAANNATGLSNIKNQYPNPVSGNVYRYRNGNGGKGCYNYFYFNGTWYDIGTSNSNATNALMGISYTGMTTLNQNGAMAEATATINCRHTHTDECYSCGIPVHTHGDGNCVYDKCGLQEHTHSGSCYGCDKVEHTHTRESCYKLICGEVAHVHDNSCKQGITGSDFSSTPTVTTGAVNNAKVLYTFTAKYQQNISDFWPDGSTTLEPGTNNPIDYWVVANSTYNHELNQNCHGFKQTTKIIKMTSDLCDTNDNVSVIKAYYNTSTKRNWKVAYYFESFDQTSPADGVNRVQYTDGTYYDIDDDYSENFATSNSRWVHKDIVGMNHDVIPPSTNGWHDPLYYDTNTGATIAPERIDNTRLNVTAHFLYNREEYPLTFYNHGKEIEGFPVNIKYGASLASYKDFEPPYPFEEKNAYTFAGWYSSPDCVDGTEYDFDNGTMPNPSFALYAKWEPVEHTVNFFFDEDKMNEYADSKDKTLIYETRQVKHGNNTGSITSPETTLGLAFGGWFFYENDVLKRFTPDNYPITRDIDVFATWGSNVPMPYIVHYKEWDPAKGDPNNLTAEAKNALNDVADDTYGWAYQGSSKKFEAKTGQPFNQLYDEYNKGWFPTYKSTSVTIQHVPDEDLKNPVQNEAWFFYVKNIPVPYIVRYLDAQTGEELHVETVYTQNENAVVTERFLPIPNYVPDMYYKRLILQYDPDHTYPDVVTDGDGHKISGGYNYKDPQENVITFYYTKSDAQRYVVHHMFQNVGGDAEEYNIYEDGILTPGGYSEYTKTEVTTTLPTDEITPLKRVGYTVVSDYSRHFNTPEKNAERVETNPSINDNGTFTVTMSPKNTGDGAELYIYYTLKEYPYTVKYLEYGAEVETPIRPEKQGPNTPYGATVTESYENLENKGWFLVGADKKEITISEDNNIIIFYYQKHPPYTVQYKPWAKGGGSVDPEQETIEYTDDSFKGSVPTAKDGYEFEGWYLDPDCTKPVDLSWLYENDRIIPDKTKINQTDQTKNVYYAKFTPSEGSLTIKRENSANEGNGEQVFVYKVYPEGNPDEAIFVTITGDGEKTINGLTAEKKYIVEQQNDWSWRFEDGEKEAVIKAGDDVTVVFKDDAKKVYGLNGNSGVKKNVKAQGGTN